MRFIHTADWQLGRPFGRLEGDVRAALGNAPFATGDRIGAHALENGVTHVLLASEISDTGGPENRTIIQTVVGLARVLVRWRLLPGNHNFARNGGLWDRVCATHLKIVETA